MTDYTLKIPDEQIGFIRLVMRSKDRGDGWRSVSGALRNFAEGMVSRQPELYETKTDGDTFMLRLSERGGVLADYF